METAFSVIVDDFEQELDTIAVLIDAASDPALGRPRARVAAAHASLLLLAATFEEFIREMARAYARAVVETCSNYDELPPRLASVAWKRTMEELARIRLDTKEVVFSREGAIADAQSRFQVTYQFCRGDLSQDIYEVLVHNENNMRPQELNSLFKLSGLKNACGLACGEDELLNALDETEAGKAHAVFIDLLEDFFDRRNEVAHSLNAASSSGPAEILSDTKLLRAFGRSLCSVLEASAPSPAAHAREDQPNRRGEDESGGLLRRLAARLGLRARS